MKNIMLVLSLFVFLNACTTWRPACCKSCYSCQKQQQTCKKKSCHTAAAASKKQLASKTQNKAA